MLKVVFVAVVAAITLAVASPAQAASQSTCAYKSKGIPVYVKLTNSNAVFCNSFKRGAGSTFVTVGAVRGAARCQWQGPMRVLVTVFGDRTYGPVFCKLLAPSMRSFHRVF